LHVLFLFAIVGLNQPASAASTGAASSPKSQIQTQPKNPADAQIERTIRLKLAKSKLNADHFTVSVTKGVATIEGSTSIMQHKGAMTRIAKASGATSVRNNIRISDAAKAKAISGLTRNRTTAEVPRAQVSSTQSPVPIVPRAQVLAPAASK
jgi:hypothetical protein